MRTQVAKTSLAAYRQLEHAHRLQPMEQKVIDVLKSVQRPMTRKQIRDKSGMELSSVCGRVKSLLESGHIELRGEALDVKTGKMQELVGLPIVQRSLFE